MGRHSFMYGSSIWAKLALAAAIIAMILFIVGYATVSWMVYQTTTNSVKVGLWNMNSCAGTECSERAVADSFKTDNFTAAQAIETIALILFIVLPFLVGVFVCVSSARVRCVALCAIVVCFLAMFFTLIGMIVWMVYVNSPYVASWSMGLTVLAGILAGIAGLLIICDGLTDDHDDYDDRRRRRSYDDRPPTYKTAPPTPRIIQGPPTKRLVPVRVF